MLAIPEIAARKKIPAETLRRWFRNGWIEGAQHYGREWVLPEELLNELPEWEPFEYDPAEARQVREAVMTQTEAASMLGVSQRTLRRWENGGTTPDRWLAPRYRQLLERWRRQAQQAKDPKC